MIVELKENVAVVTREEGDPKMKNESQLLHHVKLALMEVAMEYAEEAISGELEARRQCAIACAL